MAPVLAMAFFYLFFLAALARSQHIFSIDQSDTDSVRFSGNWSTASYPSAIGGSYAFTDKSAASVSIMLPRGTVAARYIGFPLQTSAIYSYCIDCVTTGAGNDLSDVTSIQVNGTFMNTDVAASPLSLFFIPNLDPTVPHVLTVLNSQPQNVITIDAVVVDVLTNMTVTLSSNTSTISTPSSTPLPTTSGSSIELSWTPTPTPSLPTVSIHPVSTRYPSAAPTLPPPSTTSQEGVSSGTDKSTSLPLIISLTVASAIILVVVYIIHRHVRKYRRDNPALGSDSENPKDLGTRSSSMVVARSHSLSAESNVLPAPALWRTISPNAGSLFGRFGIKRNPRLESRCIPTPSMMETLHSRTNTSESIQSNGSDNRSRPPKDMV